MAGAAKLLETIGALLTPQMEAAVKAALRRAGGVKPLPGLPTEAQLVEGQLFVPGPYGKAHEVADRYMRGQPFEYVPPDRYHPVNKEMARRTAETYEALPMRDQSAIDAYNAMIRETVDQYRAIEASGLKLTPTDAATYPYKGNPRAVAQDVADRGHMAFFKTESGFGTPEAGSAAAQSHPLMQQTGIEIGGYPMTANDLFRVVHDYFGHIKGGYGFRAGGEDNAFRAHAAMYSPQARPAMAAETRGQNSWVNFGPHGETNRLANAAETIYAPQKVATMPDWVLKYLFPGLVGGGGAVTAYQPQGQQ
jgi:hypothetical protein